MRKVILAGNLILTGILLCAGLSSCHSGGKRKSSGGNFMEKDPGRTEGSSQNFFSREREKRRQYEREFKDVSRPMNQDHFRVTPWSGRHYSPRSEELHDATRSENNTIFKF